MRTLAVALGCTAVICGLIELIAPKDRYKVLMETVLGLFALITVVSLFKSIDFSGIKTEETSAAVNSSVISRADEAYKTAYDNAIISCFKEKLDQKGIAYKSITVNSSVKDNTFTVKEVVIYTDEGQDEIKKIGDELGIVTVIEND